MSTPAEDRLQIAAGGTFDDLHQHVDPIVAAELSWGNAIAKPWYVDRHWGSARIVLRDPLHVELIRAAFAFPPGFKLRTVPPTTDRRAALALLDPELVSISAPPPDGWPTEAPDEPL